MIGTPAPGTIRPTGLELAAGTAYGEDRAMRAGGTGDRAPAPLEAFEAAVRPALERPPCLVTFSGGRDSAAVLAVATRLARRDGLDPPIPVTLRFRTAPMTEEAEWQEPLIRRLGLREWEIREVGDEMDAVGPNAARVLRRHGVLIPFNTHTHLPLVEAARGGALLTGVGGDHLFATWRWRRHADVVAGRTRPVPRDVPRLAYWLGAPRSVRLRREPRKLRAGDSAWLRPHAAERARRLATVELADQPRFWSEWVPWRVRRRNVSSMVSSLGLLGEDADALMVHPFLDATFIRALAEAGGRSGLGDRTTAMRRLFGEVLPEAHLARPTKARFDQAFWGPASERLAESWDGSGVDPELVDPDALRREWTKPLPHTGTLPLLQSLWLSADR